MGVKPTYQDFADLDLIRSDTLPNKMSTIFIFQDYLRLINSLSPVCLPYLRKGCDPLHLAGLSEHLNAVREGFEPTDRFKRSLVFKTSAIDQLCHLTKIMLYPLPYVRTISGSTISILPLFNSPYIVNIKLRIFRGNFTKLALRS